MTTSIQYFTHFGNSYELHRLNGSYIVRDSKGRETSAKLDATELFYMSDFGNQRVADFDGPLNFAKWLVANWTIETHHTTNSLVA